MQHLLIILSTTLRKLNRQHLKHLFMIALLQAEYQMLYDTYGTIITANTFDIDYDVFVKLEINKDEIVKKLMHATTY